MYYNDPNEMNCGNTPGGCNPDEAVFDAYRCPRAGACAPGGCNCCCNRGPTGPQGPMGPRGCPGSQGPIGPRGFPGVLISGPNGRIGLFGVTTSQNLTQFLSICSIDTIQINNATYNDAIIYLPEPVPAPTDCCSDCESTIRSRLPVGTPNVSIITNTQTPSTGTVIRNEFGMIVLANEAAATVTFISSCSIDLFII